MRDEMRMLAVREQQEGGGGGWVDERMRVRAASSCTCVRARAETDEMKIERGGGENGRVGSDGQAGKRASEQVRARD